MQINRRIRDNGTNITSFSSAEAQQKLSRLVLASMLWEKQFYLDGTDHATIVKQLVDKCDPKFVQALAIKARTQYKLRHVPLLLCRELARIGKLEAATLSAVIQRADEMGEFLAIYWADQGTKMSLKCPGGTAHIPTGKNAPLSNQVKKGLAAAFGNFNEYQLAKFDKASASVSIRDVMFLCHPKPVSASQEALFKRVANKAMVTPDTWETELSAGADKGATFTRLMQERKLGALAFLRNLRNMVQAGVDEGVIRNYANTVNVDKVLPFRYIAAARIVPQFEDMLEAMMFRSLKDATKLKGKTLLLVDISGSMFGAKVSAKSDLDRFDAAAALAMLCMETCEHIEVHSFTTKTQIVAPRRGFALVDAIKSSMPSGGTAIGNAVHMANNRGYDRIIVITDEQSQDTVGVPLTDKAYMLNVASYENGVSHSAWTTITGFSESVIDYIKETEQG